MLTLRSILSIPFLLFAIHSFAASPVLAGPSSTSLAERKREINAAHDAALFGKDAPFVHEEMTSKAFLDRFARETCGLEMPEGGPAPEKSAVDACDSRLKQALVNALAARYFSVDRKAIEERCKREQLACMDPQILELWIRESHNAGIELSRKEKLARLDGSNRRPASAGR